MFRRIFFVGAFLVGAAEARSGEETKIATVRCSETVSLRVSDPAPKQGSIGVVEVRSDSPAAEQGIHTGDVLVGMHKWETLSLDNVQYILSRPDLQRTGKVKFYVVRGTETLYGHLPIMLR